MFDARSLLEHMMRGAAAGAPGPATAGAGGLGDLLGQLAGAVAGAGGGRPDAPAGGLADLLRMLLPDDAPGQRAESSASDADLGGIGDIVRNLGAGGAPVRAVEPEEASTAAQDSLGDILGRLQEQMGGERSAGRAGEGGALGPIVDMLGQVLGQATEGVREGTGRIDGVTGASDRIREAIGAATGRSPDELLARLKDFINQNPLATGAAAGGLGALVLGTRTGRSIAGSALQIGGLALIGGLAYKALQNYQAGRPPVTGPQRLAVAPAGSGFDADAVSNESAIRYIRAMIAAAAADGRIDRSEQQRVLASLQQAGLGREAEAFLAGELNNPATPEEIAAGVESEADAIQLFTAARLAIDLDAEEEHDFLVGLAGALGLDAGLVAHIDAEARAAA
jgi:uncharacterized membrane protein YebE (DUF533 family)